MINEVSETLMPMIKILQNVDPLGFPAFALPITGLPCTRACVLAPLIPPGRHVQRCGEALPPHRQSVQEAEPDVGLQAWDEEGWETGE